MASTTLASRFRQYFTPNALRTYLAEFISTFLFVCAAVGSSMSSRKLMPDTTLSDPSSLVVVALANAFGLSSAVCVAGNISGGHVNPAVTFGMAIGGHINVPTALFYWGAQMLGATMACLLLRVATISQHVPTHVIAEEMTGFGASFLEGVFTFALVYTVFSASDPRRAATLGAIGPLAIGFMAGANVLASGPFTGGSMNPACSFASALVAGTFRNQAVYWVGPLVGAGIAGLLYQNVMFPSQLQPQPQDSIADGFEL